MKVFKKTKSGKVYTFSTSHTLAMLPVGAYVTFSPKETSLDNIKAAIKALRGKGMHFRRHKIIEKGVACIQVAKIKQDDKKRRKDDCRRVG